MRERAWLGPPIRRLSSWNCEQKVLSRYQHRPTPPLPCLYSVGEQPNTVEVCAEDTRMLTEAECRDFDEYVRNGETDGTKCNRRKFVL